MENIGSQIAMINITLQNCIDCWLQINILWFLILLTFLLDWHLKQISLIRCVYVFTLLYDAVILGWNAISEYYRMSHQDRKYWVFCYVWKFRLLEVLTLGCKKSQLLRTISLPIRRAVCSWQKAWSVSELVLLSKCRCFHFNSRFLKTNNFV